MTDHEVTVGVEFGTLLVKLEQQVFKLQIWDTAGQERFRTHRRESNRALQRVFDELQSSKGGLFYGRTSKDQCGQDSTSEN